MARVDLDIRTEDGVAKAALFRPDGGRPERAGVILYMDAFGPRPAMHDMATRLAGLGYGVLVPDLFYRRAPYGPFDAKTAFANDRKRAELMDLMQATKQAMTAADTRHFLKALADAGVPGQVGTVGYCMGGGRAIIAAATYPDRIAAAASFHGGNLASDEPDSPHLKVGAIRSRVYVASAGVDRSFPPEQSTRLDTALRTAEVDYIIENYIGMEHGWTVPDHGVFNPAGAERHWARLGTFFGEALG